MTGSFKKQYIGLFLGTTLQLHAHAMGSHMEVFHASICLSLHGKKAKRYLCPALTQDSCYNLQVTLKHTHLANQQLQLPLNH